MSPRAFPALLLSAALLAACSSTRAESLPQFGVVVRGSELQAITWEMTASSELSDKSLVLTQPLAAARSAELPLAPLQLYEVYARMGRWPGTAARFTISYLDAQGRPQAWSPTWQLPGAVRPNWLPLSPHSQMYVQGLVLPPGASQPHLELKLDAPANAQLARYSRWELSELRIEARGAVRCCEQLGPNRLLGGALDTPVYSGFPLGWTQWSLDASNRLELCELSDGSVPKRVLRAKPGKIAILASTTPVPVTRGSAFRIAVRVRGEGRVQLSAHALSADRPLLLRVGNTGSERQFDVHAGHWTELSMPWFAEAAHIASVQVYVALDARGEMELQAVELRPYEELK